MKQLLSVSLRRKHLTFLVSCLGLISSSLSFFVRESSFRLVAQVLPHQSVVDKSSSPSHFKTVYSFKTQLFPSTCLKLRQQTSSSKKGWPKQSTTTTHYSIFIYFVKGITWNFSSRYQVTSSHSFIVISTWNHEDPRSRFPFDDQTKSSDIRVTQVRRHQSGH